MSFFLLLITGFIAGGYGALVGLGGGFLIVPALICLYEKLSPERITAISLSIIAVSSLSATTAYIRLKKVDLKIGGIITAFQIPVMIIGSILTKYISIKPFSFAFGILLVILSILLMLKPTARAPKSKVEGINLIKLALVGAITGTLSSLLGIGGGIVLVPALNRLYGMEAHQAVATSLFVLFFSSLTGAITHAFITGGFKYLSIGVPLGAGVILGSQIGARISGKFRGKTLMRLLSLGIAIAGIKLIERGLS
ncbi:MAG: sulfite exporter TauE/SafE family protein [Synergistetes bacterium]|nr:sulfite exporter TauE/SafE family protein [Synergistota bacterium]